MANLPPTTPDASPPKKEGKHERDERLRAEQQEAEALRVFKLEAALTDFRAHLARGEMYEAAGRRARGETQPEPDSAQQVFGTFAGASVCSYFDNLQQFSCEAFGAVRRDFPSELRRAVHHVSEREGIDATELLPTSEGWAPHENHWYVLRDSKATVPLDIADHNREAYARDWLASVPEFRDREAIVVATAGYPIEVVLWDDKAVEDTTVRAWCKSAYDGARFSVPTYPWHFSDERVYLPAKAPAASAFHMARPEGSSVPGRMLDVGLAGLQRQFRAGGLPLGARVVIGGLTGQGKTTLALHLAETAVAQGWFVVWLAYDEARDEIRIRRLQRSGLAPAVAQTMPADAQARLDVVDLFVVKPEQPFEAYAQEAHEEANGKPVLFVVDSIQKLDTTAGAGKGERERITAAVDAIQDCQRRFPSVVVMTSEIARGSGATKGSGSIDFGATLDLRVRRQGTKLAVAVQKNRHGSEEPFELQIDQERQTLIDPAAIAAEDAKRSAHAGIWAQLTKALKERGPLSGKKLELYVKAKEATLRIVLAQRLEVGDLVREGDVYRLRAE